MPGTILLHRNFQFSDGTSKAKYLIILGRSDGVSIAAKTTSKGHRYRNDHGCQCGNYYPAFLLSQGCCCFQLSTWVCLDELLELKDADLSAGLVNGLIYRYGSLSNELTRDIQFCAKNCDDISSHQEEVINRCLVPA